MSKTDVQEKTESQIHSENPILVRLPKNTIAIPAPKDKKATFVCVMCRERFKSHVALKHHFKKHAEKTIDIRGRPMEQSTLLDFPKKESIALSLIPCEFCPEILPNISKAIQHKFRKHRTEGTNYFCEFCGKLFPIKISLEQHKDTTHKDEVKKSVETPSTSDSAVKEANSDETRNVELTCKFCLAIFVTENALRFHEQGVHKFEQNLLLPIYVPPPSTKIKMNNSSEVFSVYYCYLCGSEYIMKYNLRKHLRDHHKPEEREKIPEDGIIRCKTCEAFFYTKKGYETHTIHHRPGDLYVTSEEHRRKVVARVDQDFDFRRVPQNSEKFVQSLRKRKQHGSGAKPSTSNSKVSEVEESDESMSPPSSAPDSSDDEITTNKIMK